MGIVSISALFVMGGAITIIVYSNVRDWNQLGVDYQFKSDSRIFGLYPSDRVSKPYRVQRSGYSVQGSEEYFQEMVASPVYLDIRYWQNFRKAKVEILYEKDLDVDFQIGYKVGKDFQWKLFPIESEQNRHFDRSESDERSGKISKDSGRGYEDLPRRSESKAGISRLRSASLEMTLDGEFISHNNIHRWVLSSNNVQDLGKAIRIYGIKFKFTK